MTTFLIENMRSSATIIHSILIIQHMITATMVTRKHMDHMMTSTQIITLTRSTIFKFLSKLPMIQCTLLFLSIMLLLIIMLSCISTMMLKYIIHQCSSNVLHQLTMLNNITFQYLFIMKFQHTMSHWLTMMHLSIIKLRIMLWNQSIIVYLSIMNYLHTIRHRFTTKFLIITPHIMRSQFITKPLFII